MMSAVLVAGPVFLDIIPNGFTGFPEDGTERYVDSISFSPGGAGITSAVLALLGVRVELAAAVGDDTAGAFLRNELARLGVGLSRLTYSKTPTDASLVFPSGGDRSFITAVHRNPELPSAVSRAILDGLGGGLSRVHVGFELFGDASVREACRRAAAAGVAVSTGAGFDTARDWSPASWNLIEGCDAFFMNRDELRMITRDDDVPKALARFGSRVRVPVATLGADGCAILDGAGEARFIPSPPTRVVNPCGAGDSFTAAFLYALDRGLDASRAAELAVRVGALAVSSPGSIPEGLSESWLRDGGLA